VPRFSVRFTQYAMVAIYNRCRREARARSQLRAWPAGVTRASETRATPMWMRISLSTLTKALLPIPPPLQRRIRGKKSNTNRTMAQY
jgi:hypothetical protein